MEFQSYTRVEWRGKIGLKYTDFSQLIAKLGF